MRPVVLYTLLSLDGVAESPDQFVFDWDDRLDANLAVVIAEQDAVLLGHQMYDEWAEYWPTSDVEPFASFINGVQKYVVASSQPDGDWGPRTVVTDHLEGFVAELKQTDGGTIGIHGSIRLAQSLLRAGLVDELHLFMAPLLFGGKAKAAVGGEGVARIADAFAMQLETVERIGNDLHAVYVKR